VIFGRRPSTRFHCGFWTSTALVDAQERGAREGGREGMREFSTELMPRSFGGGLHGLWREICVVWHRNSRDRGEAGFEEGVDAGVAAVLGVREEVG
jgi:hypothetical protein